MNAIPYFDYSMAPFWPSYQNKIVGVLNRALREQSCSRVRRILLRLPWEHDNAFSCRKTWLGMDFIETVSALMNATPGRDLCWILTRHPEKPEYHVVLCVRQEYFDGPELDRLILDAWSNVLGFASPGEAAPYQKQITRDVVLDSRSPDCEDILKELIWAFSDFARDRRGVRDPEARYLAGNPWYCPFRSRRYITVLPHRISTQAMYLPCHAACILFVAGVGDGAFCQCCRHCRRPWRTGASAAHDYADGQRHSAGEYSDAFCRRGFT